MKIKCLCFVTTVIFLLVLSGCVFETSGDSLYSFSQRMNEYNKSYKMSPNGYIIDDSEASFTKFYKFSNKEILLKFRHDSKNRLTQMHIVFDDSVLEESQDAYIFITDCVKAFCQSEAVAEQIFNATDFDNTIKTIEKKTISAETENIKAEIDTTRLGTVISIYKDI